MPKQTQFPKAPPPKADNKEIEKLKKQIAALEQEIKLVYLEVPVMLKYAFGANNIKPYIMAGPTIGYNLSAKRKFIWVDESGDEEIDNIKEIDFGICFGAGVYLPMDNNSFFVQASYSYGLTNILEEPENEINTKGLQIFAGFTLPLVGE